jgi:hypothetical protein
MADPEGFTRDAVQRLRRGGTAAPAMTLLTMLDIARFARARAPAREATERARLDAAIAAVRAAEQRWSLAPSPYMILDRHGAAWRALTGAARNEVETAYRLYNSQVEAWQTARALTVFTAAWEGDLEIAAQRYIEASLEFGQATVRDGGADPRPFEERGNASAPFRRWLACYAPVLEGNPAAAGDLICEWMRAMRSDLSLRRASLLSSVGAQPRSAYFRLLQVDQYLHGLVEDLVTGLIGLQDDSFADLLRAVAQPVQITTDSLNDTFGASPNGQLAFRCVADWIDADLGMRAPLASGADAPCDGAPRRSTHVDPARFAALEHALTLARLALLDQAGVRRLTARFGGNPAEPRLGAQPRYSVLLDSVRSLDGSQQWRGTALPFPRAAPYRNTPPLRSFGYAPGAAGPPGFPLYQSAALRRTAFTALFPRPFEGAILRRAEMQPAAYPFRPCADDPLRDPPPPAGPPTTEIC